MIAAMYLSLGTSCFENIFTGPESIITNLCNYLLFNGMKFIKIS
jgi:hypothetical protein